MNNNIVPPWEKPKVKLILEIFKDSKLLTVKKQVREVLKSEEKVS